MNGNGKKKRSRWIIYGGIVTALVLVVVVAAWAFTRGGTKIDPSKLAKVEKGDLAKSVVATGKVEPITKVEVKSKASGIVKKLYVEYGDRVKKGQLLAQLDKEEIEAQVAQSQAGLEAAEASLKGAEADYERAKVDAEGPDVPLLKRAYDRAVGMAKDGVVSHLRPRRCREKLRDGAEQAERRQGAGHGIARPRSPSPRRRLHRIGANLKQLEEQLGYTDIDRRLTASCSRATWKSATPSAPFSCWVPRPPW